MDIFQLAHNDFNWNEARIKMDRAMLVDDEHSDTYWKPENVGQIYSLNSLNYRTDEILENRDLIFAGCSNTFGQGLTNDAIWTTQVSSHLKISNYNLGVCGTSTMSIINNLFNYFQKIGNPKILMCIFPDFLRMDVWSNSDHMNGLANITWNREYEKKEIKYHLLMDDAKRYKFSKQPHVAEDIIPEQLPFALSIQYIKMLETYCNAVGIKLIWSTWEHRQEKYILNNKKDLFFKNFIPLYNNHWHKEKKDNFKCLYHEKFDAEHNSGKFKCEEYTKCHVDQQNKYGQLFDIAMDTDINNINNVHRKIGHYGAHRHIHWAELFLKALDNYDRINDKV